MPRYWRKFQTLDLEDGTIVRIFRGVPGVTENCFCFNFSAHPDVSDKRVADINRKGSRYCKYLQQQVWARANNMGPVIMFEQESTYVGRNGKGKMLGIEVVEDIESGAVRLTPINSRGLAHGNIHIPADKLEEFIQFLEKIQRKRANNG